MTPDDRTPVGRAPARRSGTRGPQRCGGGPLPLCPPSGRCDPHHGGPGQTQEAPLAPSGRCRLPCAGCDGRWRRLLPPVQHRSLHHLPGREPRCGADGEPAGKGAVRRPHQRGCGGYPGWHGAEGDPLGCGHERHRGLPGQKRLCGRAGQLHPHYGGR